MLTGYPAFLRAGAIGLTWLALAPNPAWSVGPGATTTPSTEVVAPRDTSKETRSSGYESFRILEPKPGDDLPVRDGKVAVTVGIRPPLKTAEGHGVKVVFDGKMLEHPPVGTSFLLEDVPPGNHTLELALVDKQGSVLAKTPPVAFKAYVPDMSGRTVPR